MQEQGKVHMPSQNEWVDSSRLSPFEGMVYKVPYLRDWSITEYKKEIMVFVLVGILDMHAPNQSFNVFQDCYRQT